MSINAKAPESYFFTNSAFINNKAFGSVNQNEFQITTGVAGSEPAYAVTDGFLFFAKHGDSTDKVNIILKPKKDIGLGIKIKYFVYRGINASDLFKDINGTRQLEDPTTLEFLKTVWDSYTELYGPDAKVTADKIGYLDVSSSSTSEIIKKFFAKGEYNLLGVEKGTHIGNFFTGFGGFEIVIDDGEYSQEKSDTGLDFSLGFASATSCILKTDQDHPSNFIFGGKKNSNIDSKIFRENIYRFIDPAAFYGLHITKEKEGTVHLKNGITKNSFKNYTGIYTNIVSKFINKNKIYIYIKSERNRSFKFYKADADKKVFRSNDISNQSSWGFESFTNEHGWPLIVKPSGITTYGLYLSPGTSSYISSNILLEELKHNFNKDKLRSGYLLRNAKYFKFSMDKDAADNNVSQLIYLNFFEPSENKLNDLFGPINLDPIFEDADFTSGTKISWVSHLNSTIVRKGVDLGVYNMKGIIDRSDSSDLNQLRTYMLLPQASNIPVDSFYELKYPPYVNAGCCNIALQKNTSTDFCKNVIGVEDGEIWKGKFTDAGTEVKSLVFRSDANILTLDYYILGITQKNYTDLIGRVPTGVDLYNTNFFIDFGPNESSDPKNFGKYEIQLKYDDKQGNITVTTEPTVSKKIFLYTIDGMYFFTQNYSENFKYCNEFANTTVDFRPEKNWMRLYAYKGVNALNEKYSDRNVLYGFDWLRKGDSKTLPNPDPDYDVYDQSLFSIIGVGDPSDLNGAANFQLDPKQYIYAKGLYKVIPTTWQLTNTAADYDKDYAPSWLSIPNIANVNVITKFKINLKVSCFKKPTTLKLYFDSECLKILKVDNSPTAPAVKEDGKGKYIIINAPASNSFKWFTLDIENIKPLEKISTIIAEADNVLAGKLYIMPNDPKLTQKQKTAFITLTTSAGVRNLHPFEIENLNIFNSHANIQIDRTDNPITVSIADYLYPDNSVNTKDAVNGKTIFEYLSEMKSEYNGYVKIFLMNDRCRKESSDGTISRVGGSTLEEMKLILLFDPVLDSTRTALAHEFYHVLGVQHTFSSGELGKNALLTLQMKKTNNLMDYGNDDFELKHFIQGSFFWQWVIARRYTLKN